MHAEPHAARRRGAGRLSPLLIALLGGVSAASLLHHAALGQTATPSTEAVTPAAPVPLGNPPAANSANLGSAAAALSGNAATYFPPAYLSALKAPLPQVVFATGGFPPSILQREYDLNAHGLLETYQPGGATSTATNAFFQSLGTNGRSCGTCHLPPNGMSISLDNVQLRFLLSGGKDPLFAPVDGANCPNLVPSASTSGALLGGALGQGTDLLSAHSLILTRGVIRIFLPVPDNADYTIKVLSDPTGCNFSPTYDQSVDPTTGKTHQIVSVFRRPRLSTNLAFALASLGGPDPRIMWDGREPTLESQAIDATLGHAQATSPPTQEQVQQMVAFENGLYSAQIRDNKAGALDQNGAFGGPVFLFGDLPAQTTFPLPPPFNEYDAWSTSSNANRESIARGQALFDNKTFTIANVTGFNDLIGLNPLPGATCGICHNQPHDGSDVIPGPQRNIGVSGDSVNFGGNAPAKDLPIFQITCKAGSSTPFNGNVVVTNDPGKALISGKCADVGTLTVPQLRGLASHAPYFHDGSAKTLDDVVNFYNKRFNIGLTPQEHTDLVNFLNAL